MDNRRICVVTGGRADYGLLLPLLREIENEAKLTLQLIVSGSHLSKQFGLTVEAIEMDGIPIAARVDMLQEGDDSQAVSRSVASGIIGFSEAYEKLIPHIVIVLGDRFEILAAATAAMISRIPIAHIHGGEVTEGAIDDVIRHGITKMAHLHFVSAEPYRQRVIQLGEDPEKVFLVGAPGLDSLRILDFIDRSSLETDLGISLTPPVILVTYHPVTLQENFAEHGMMALCEALEKFPQATIIITGVNSDPGHIRITRAIKEFADRYPKRVMMVESLGQCRYLSMMKIADVVVGNSSSGIIEAPALAVPTVNIGNRQTGRLRASSIIDCEENVASISSAIDLALSENFRKSIATVSHQYGDGSASKQMVDILSTINMDGILIKKFFDLGQKT